MGNLFKFLFEYNDYIEDIENSEKDDYIYNEISKRTKFDRLSIIEELIFTYPIDKSVNILKRRFPELDITIELDGEIFIQCLDKNIEHYIKIITNIGYFISKLTFDGEEWIKDFDKSDKPLAIILEPKYDYGVNTPNILYHSSPIRFKNKILNFGLSPRSGNKISNHPERIYLSDSIDKCMMFGNYLKSIDKSDMYDNEWILYEIDGRGLKKLYSDINFRIGGFYTTENIDKRWIKIIKEFKT
jgi:hypothetical protein